MTTVLNILTFVIISACFVSVNAGKSIMACMLNNLGLLAVRELQFLTEYRKRENLSKSYHYTK